MEFVAIVGEGTEPHITSGDDVFFLYRHRFVCIALERCIFGRNGRKLGQVLVDDPRLQATPGDPKNVLQLLDRVVEGDDVRLAAESTSPREAASNPFRPTTLAGSRQSPRRDPLSDGRTKSCPMDYPGPRKAVAGQPRLLLHACRGQGRLKVAATPRALWLRLRLRAAGCSGRSLSVRSANILGQVLRCGLVVLERRVPRGA